MARVIRWMALIWAAMMVLPGLPSDAAPSVLTTFTGGMETVPVEVGPRPSENRSLSVTLPWDAAVSSASLELGGEGLPETRNGQHSAASLATGDTRNLTIETGSLRLNRSSWSWEQEGAGLGAGCDIGGGRILNGLSLDHSNPTLQATGGGIWTHRVALDLTETGGTARSNESIMVHLSFPPSDVRNPQKEVRVCDASLSELPSCVQNVSFSGGFCTGADVLFVAPSLAPYSKDTYYIFYGNPSAGAPMYARQVYLAESFSAGTLSAQWTVSNPEGLSYTAGGELRINGTATCTTKTWQGLSFESAPQLPHDFSLQARINISDASGSGYSAILSIFQDTQNFVNIGIQYDSGQPQYSPPKYVLVTGQGGTVSLAASANAVIGMQHLFRIDCSAGTYQAYVDGGLLGSANAVLSSPRIQIAAAARAAGDSQNVSFDEVIAHLGYLGIGALDPPPVQTIGGEEDTGYVAAGSMVSPILDNSARLPLGLIRLDALLPAGTAANVSVLGPDNETLAEGLGNGDVVSLSSEDHPSIRLSAAISTSDPRITPTVRAWGIGGRWVAGLDDPSSSVNLSLSQGAIQIARSPERWAKLPSPALNPGITSTFDDIGVARPCVIFSEGLYRMYYAGYDGNRWRIGLATSDDGLNWTRHTDNPVLVPGGVPDWDSSHVDWPYVIYNGTGYQMWYAGSNDGGASYQIGYANSRDGVRWTRQPGPVLSMGGYGSWNANGAFAPRVLLQGSTYTMWYAGRNATSTMIGAATSSDGIIWSEGPANPVMLPRPGWSSAGVLPGGIETGPDQGYRMWFAGFNTTTTGVGYAVSADGHTWTVSPGPVITNGSGGAFDRNGATNASVMFSESGRMWYSAYNGTRWRICAARAGYFPEGDILSMPVELGTAPASSALTFSATIPANGSIIVSARTSYDGTGWGPWSTMSTTPSPFLAGRYLQWKARLVAGNGSSPRLDRVNGLFSYHCLQGEVRPPEVILSPGQTLTAATASAATDGSGCVILEASVDQGAVWTALEPGVPRNISGTRLAFRVKLAGNYTSTPSLAAISVSYSMLDLPADVEMDAGGDGTSEYNMTGVLNRTVVVTELAAAVNSYLEKHRYDQGDWRAVPLVLSSSARGVINASGLHVEYGATPLVNHPPEIRSLPPDRAQVGQPFFYHLDARDQDPKDVLTYSLLVAPEGMSLSMAADVSWVPVLGQVGYQPVVLGAFDGHERVEQNFTVVVSNGLLNMPPRITSVPPLSATVGYEYVYNVSASDPNSEPVRFSLAASNPAGVTINESSGRLSWVPAASQAGDRSLDVLVGDLLDTVHHRFNVTVSLEGANSLPAVSSSPPPAARVNLSYIFRILASDPDGDALVYSLISAPPGATLSPDGAFDWMARLPQPASVSVVVRISDGKGFVLYAFNISVLPENRAPVFINLPAILKVPRGQGWSFTPQVSDPDGGLNLTFGLVSGPAGMTMDPSSGLMNWRPGPSQSGSFPVIIQVSDGINNTTQDFVLTVAPAKTEMGLMDGVWPVLAVMAIAAGAAVSVIVLVRRGKVEPGPRKKEKDAPQKSEPAAPPETYEKEDPQKGDTGTGVGLSALPPPEAVAGSSESEPMKTVAKAPDIKEAAPSETEIPVTAPAAPEPHVAHPSPPPSPPPAPSLPVEAAAYLPPAPPLPPAPSTRAASASVQSSLPYPAPAPSPPPSPAAAVSPSPQSFSASSPIASPSPTKPPPPSPSMAPSPYPSRAEPISFKDDMDFLRSYLVEKPSDEPRKPEVARAEWSQITDYAKGLDGEKPMTRGAARPQPSVPPAERDMGRSAPSMKDEGPSMDARRTGTGEKTAVPEKREGELPAAPRRGEGELPAAPEKRVTPERQESTPSLDDILKELDED